MIEPQPIQPSPSNFQPPIRAEGLSHQSLPDGIQSPTPKVTRTLVIGVIGCVLGVVGFATNAFGLLALFAVSISPRVQDDWLPSNLGVSAADMILGVVYLVASVLLLLRFAVGRKLVLYGSWLGIGISLVRLIILLLRFTLGTPTRFSTEVFVALLSLLVISLLRILYYRFVIKHLHEPHVKASFESREPLDAILL